MNNDKLLVNGKEYLKMIQISYKEKKYQITTPIDHNEIGPKFFEVIEKDKELNYQEVNSETLHELKKIYHSPRAIEF